MAVPNPFHLIRRNESIENGFSILRADTWTRISQRLRSCCRLPVLSAQSVTGPTSEYVNRIVDQIRNNLLQLTDDRERGPTRLQFSFDIETVSLIPGSAFSVPRD
jgi:hypothetical protein